MSGLEEEKMGYLFSVLTSSIQVQNRSFEAMNRPRTATKCNKMMHDEMLQNDSFFPL